MKLGKEKSLFLIMGVLIFLVACQTEDEAGYDQWKESGEEFAGGATTVLDLSENAFGIAAPNLEGDKDLEFVTGNSFFRRNWVTAPSSTEDLDGLGPVFNARSCGACHFKDGRGAPPLTASEETIGLLFRLSRPTEVEWETIDDPNYGGQFNHLAILGVDPEGKVSVSYTEVPGTYPDGTKYSLRQPHYDFYDLKYGDFEGIQVSPRVAPHMVGLGLLEAIAEEVIVAAADPDDLDGDGISGRPNYVWDILSESNQLGRFGWKANQPNVRQQVAGAFQGDIGITSTLFPDQPCASGQGDCNDANTGGEPELAERILDRVTLYSAALAVPKRRDWEDETVLKGKAFFNQIGCAKCHTPKYVTGNHDDFPEFAGQPIYPYTDLLLHDMGEALADNRPDGLATGVEWKTPPLWGLGLIPIVNDHFFLLHDGRARGVEEAILWHGSEAEQVKQIFMELSAEERAAVVSFVESL